MINMKNSILFCLICLAAATGCKRVTTTPRPTIPLVTSIAKDTSGLSRIAAGSRSIGPEGSIAIIGEPSDVIELARLFLITDKADNVDGHYQRDSLPDFAGENFDAILDAHASPYSSFLVDDKASLDSLREAAVVGAMFAWDSCCFRSAHDIKARLRKEQAKILIFTSSAQAEYGLFDVDTLLQLTGGSSRILSPAKECLKNAVRSGTSNICVWTSEAVKNANAWQGAFKDIGGKDKNITVLSPDEAVDVRNQLRSILRQYLATSLTMDALIIDNFTADLVPIYSELSIIRLGGTEEDARMEKMLSPSMIILEPANTIIDATFSLLRQEDLFSHRISLPMIKYYETETSAEGVPVLVEISESYVKKAYVQDIN